MTTPQIIIALWLAAGPVVDLYQHRNADKETAWWVGRIIGHAVYVGGITYTLHLGGFW